MKMLWFFNRDNSLYRSLTDSILLKAGLWLILTILMPNAFCGNIFEDDFGSYKNEKDPLKEIEKKWGRISTEQLSIKAGLLVFKGTIITRNDVCDDNFSATVEIKYQEAEKESAAVGFSACVHPANGSCYYLALAYYKKGAQIHFWKKDAAGKWHEWYTKEYPAELGQSYKLSLSVAGKLVQACVNGKLIASFTDKERLAGKRLILNTYLTNGFFEKVTIVASPSNGEPEKSCYGVPDSDGFFRNWVVAGSFPVKRKIFDFKAALHCNAIADDKIAGIRPDGKAVTWEKFLTPRIDLFEIYHTEYSVAYASVWVYSPRNLEECCLQVGSDDASIVQLNGKTVYEFTGGRAAFPDQDYVKSLRLKKGWNHIGVRTVNGSGGWAFYFRLMDKSGSPIRNLCLSPAPVGTDQQISSYLVKTLTAEKDDKTSVKQKAKLFVKVRKYEGKPAIFIDGKKKDLVAYYLHELNTADIKGFSDAGVHLLTFDIFSLTDHDDELNMAIQTDPELLFLPRIFVGPSKRWTDEHPDEKLVDEDGKPLSWPQPYSIASSLWVREWGEKIRNYVERLEAKFGDRIIGYQIGAGICFTEWIWALDRSPASRNAFRAWVRKKYDNNIKLVNQSWHSDLKNFDEIGLPDGLRYVTYDQALTDKNWHDGDCGIFVNIKAHAKRSDYYRFHNEITARRIEDFARIIKDVTHGQKLCGAFYGYNTWNNIPARFAIGVGHLSIEKLLESDYIDFIAGVINYYDRGAGGVDFQLQAPKSIQASGKITFLENDIRTCLVSNDSLKLKIETMPDTLAVMTRNAAYAITNDCLMWWMDLGGGWYRNGQIMKRVKELQPLFGKKGYSPKPRIAIVLDEQAPYYLESGSLALLSLVHYQALEFARIGAPYDIIRLSDLKNRRADDYKMYVFLGTFSIDPALRKYLYDVFEKNRAVVLWGYGSGIYDGEKCSPGNISLTTGIGIKTHVSRGGLKAVSTGGSELSSGLQDITFGGKLRQATTVLTTVFEGVEPEISPVTYIDDPNVLPLASFVSDGRVAAGMKKMGEWRSVYFGTDNIPARLMQNLARSAGVHLYTDRTEPVYVGNGYLAISSAVGGQHEIKLPRKGDVYEAITGKCLVRGVDNFQALIPPKGTALFQINYER